MPAPAHVLPASDLTRFATELFQKAGASADDAAAIAEVLVWASLRGIDSHGLTRIPRYVDMLASGEANPTPEIRVDRSWTGTALVHADHAPGPVALRMAADVAVEIGRSVGVGAVGVEQTVHTGAIGYYTDRIARAGLVGVVFVAGMPNMGYTGARGAAVATSPLSVAVPDENGTAFLLDMATATIALGKIAQYRASGTPLPEGSAATADGTPTTDPELAKMPLPLGGAKGSGMSLAFELITSVLVGAPILAAVHTGAEGSKRHRQNALVLALNPDAFGDAATFRGAVADTIVALKGLPTAEGGDGVVVPGERSAAVATQRSSSGVPVSAKVWTELTAASAKYGVPLPTVDAAP